MQIYESFLEAHMAINESGEFLCAAVTLTLAGCSVLMYLNTNRNHSQQKPLRRREMLICKL
jgi:hypothetical protein